MNDIVLWIIIAILGVVILGYAGHKIVQITKASPEEKKKLLVTFIKGFVALAEKEIGHGHGAEKLALVEKYFTEKAPFVYKMFLQILGKENLKDLIELALKEIKESFGK